MQAIRVQTHAGYKGNQRPTAFEYEDHLFQVQEVLSQWVEQNPMPGGGSRWYFRLKADDGKRYLIFYDDCLHGWYMKAHSSQE